MKNLTLKNIIAETGGTYYGDNDCYCKPRKKREILIGQQGLGNIHSSFLLEMICCGVKKLLDMRVIKAVVDNFTIAAAAHDSGLFENAQLVGNS